VFLNFIFVLFILILLNKIDITIDVIESITAIRKIKLNEYDENGGFVTPLILIIV
jgi:hypothetical protein